ncbi:unnamed protein product [Wuchereria bancrofti]|uniref:Uncharacterized protein n=1 Tax=Wuchereria bancrofti TaxID=6293 RepID=A0A3P7DYU9_WUCBA|nr:unnamed protein product [Wuchereria bancrofti]
MIQLVNASPMYQLELLVNILRHHESHNVLKLKKQLQQH